MNKKRCSEPCAEEAKRQYDLAYRAGKRRRDREARRLSRLAAREPMHCEVCEGRLPLDCMATRRFCGTVCQNAYSLIHRRESRYASNRARRARIRGAGGSGVSARDWRRLCSRFGGCCAYCDTAGQLTMDHVVPLSRGGQHAIGNILPACLSCNSSKSDELLIFWRLKIASARLVAATAA